MVTLCLSFNPATRHSPPFFPPAAPGGRRRSRGGVGVGFAVFSIHSNARILKSNRRSPHGRRISPYQDEEEKGEKDEEDEEDDEEEDEAESQARSSSDDEYSDSEACNRDRRSDQKLLSLSSRSGSNRKSGIRRLARKEQDEGPSRIRESLKLAYGSEDVKHNTVIIDKRNSNELYNASNRSRESCSMDIDGKGKLENGKFTESRLQKLTEELGFDEKWFPLIGYLSQYGLNESHFVSIYERHMPCLQISVASAKERLEFLLSVGVKERDIRRILLRQPQILEYTVENNLKSHVAFLASLGIPDSRIGQIITAAPSLFSYNVENSLKPTIRYLVEEVGIKGSDVSKVVQLSPQILVQRIDNSWNSRFCFLSRELGAPRDSIVKMVTKHPQLLHYSIEDGIQPRINFLRSIGMHNSEILKVLTSLTQVLSLSLEGNLKPKYLYLVNELHNEVQSLTKYPMYLSLSLEQRIRPRHRFLVSLKKAPRGPFPLSSLVPTDECFCRQWAGTSLEKYLAFRQTLLLTDFAKKYERK